MHIAQDSYAPCGLVCPGNDYTLTNYSALSHDVSYLDRKRNQYDRNTDSQDCGLVAGPSKTWQFSNTDCFQFPPSTTQEQTLLSRPPL